MSKKQTEEEVKVEASEVKVVELTVGMEVIFTPADDQGTQKGVILALPAEGSCKYKVKLENGDTFPINRCYLKGAE